MSTIICCSSVSWNIMVVVSGGRVDGRRFERLPPAQRHHAADAGGTRSGAWAAAMAVSGGDVGEDRCAAACVHVDVHQHLFDGCEGGAVSPWCISCTRCTASPTPSSCVVNSIGSWTSTSSR
ncbi:MAG: hypothetical protein R2713_01815 [Ilumatobacteraceae bacterium]